MTIHPLPLRRAARSLLRLDALLAGALLAFAPVATRAAADQPATVTHERVSPAGLPAEIGYFGTSPESPDGRKIAYVVYDRNPEPGPKGGSPGGLYLCDADLTHHVKIRSIDKILSEDGARQIWIDNDTLAYMDFLPGKGPVTYIVRKTGDLLHGPYEGYLGHGDTPDGSVLLWTDKRQYPNGSSLGPSGIYRYKDGAVKQVVDLARDFGPLNDRLDGSDTPADWTMFHPQFSTNGTYISVRLDTKIGLEHLVTCKADGTDVRLFKTTKKPLHQQWYDDSTLFGHDRAFEPVDGGARFEAKRWDRDGNYIGTLAGIGNHLGISPDRKYLVSENLYELDPVVMTLYRTGNIEPLTILMNVPAGNVWKMKNHVNPAFSRDGRKVYFNQPIDGMPQVHRIDLGSLIRAGD